MNHTNQKCMKTLVRVKFFLEYHYVGGNFGLLKDVKGMNKYQSLDEYFEMWPKSITVVVKGPHRGQMVNFIAGGIWFALDKL